LIDRQYTIPHAEAIEERRKELKMGANPTLEIFTAV
jgi:hypothetical protein